MEYFHDYVILTKRLYNLFKLWYRRNGDDTCVKTINYNLIEFTNYFQMESEAELFSNKNFCKNWPVLKINHQKNNVNLIEVYPVFSKYFKYDEILSSIKVVVNMESIKDILEKVLNNPTSNVKRTIYFSRKSSFGFIKNFLYDLGTLPHGSKQNTRLWIYTNGELEIINDESFILENLNITEKFIIVVEIKNNNQWPSNSLFLNSNLVPENKNHNIMQKKSKNFHGKGILNIGNTCYFSSLT